MTNSVILQLTARSIHPYISTSCFCSKI